MADVGQKQADIPMRLQSRIMRARHAIARAGFQSLKFRPMGGALRMDVVIPVMFDDMTLTDAALTESVKQQIVSKAGRVAVVEPPAVVKRKPGRPKKTA